MRIAVPLEGGLLSAHFGHCDRYAFVDVDPQTHEVLEETVLTPPPHEPGVLPAWVAEKGADAVITGGVGHRALQLFARHGVEVVTGAQPAPAAELATAFSRGELASGENACDHGHHRHRSRHGRGCQH
jgi:predicted Fe-Mo cluster-binding NifX family protein